MKGLGRSEEYEQWHTPSWISDICCRPKVINFQKPKFEHLDTISDQRAKRYMDGGGDYRVWMLDDSW